MLSLEEIARQLGGWVQRSSCGPKVAAPAPGKRKGDPSLSVQVDADGNPRVFLHRDDVTWEEAQAYVRERCGLPEWQPRPKKRMRPVRVVSAAERAAFVGETLAVLRDSRRQGRAVTGREFALLASDLRLAGREATVADYGRQLAVGAADIALALAEEPRHRTADQRAEILGLTYEKRQAIGLRRTGSIDVDKAGRERARRDRYNARRRAQRQAERAVAREAGVNRRSELEEVVMGIPSHQVVAESEVEGEVDDLDSEIQTVRSQRLGFRARGKTGKFAGRVCRRSPQPPGSELWTSMKTVDPFYLSPAWRRLRAAALERDGHRCQAPGCGELATIVDHIRSRRAGGRDELANLRSLCRRCDNAAKERPGGRRPAFRTAFDAAGNPIDPTHPWHQPAGVRLAASPRAAAEADDFNGDFADDFGLRIDRVGPLDGNIAGAKGGVTAGVEEVRVSSGQNRPRDG